MKKLLIVLFSFTLIFSNVSMVYAKEANYHEDTIKDKENFVDDQAENKIVISDNTTTKSGNTVNNFCQKSGSVLQVIGYVLFILKIVVPVIIIVLASIDFTKAVISGEDKAIKEQSIKLFKRILLGVLIFFIPLIIRLIFFSISYFSEDMQQEFDNCVSCLTTPSSCDTSFKGGIFK